ncbi:MAG: outer membrane beta-barrel protein [Gemmatimonadota bacterium]|nr:outer membrane beta-barrel protein [Gemmatimonadota bacterium]
MRYRAERRAAITSAALLASAVALTAPSLASAQVVHGGHVHGEPEYVEEVQAFNDGPRWKIGGGLGMLSPSGEFSQFVRTGFSTNVHAVLGLEPSNTIALRLDGGWGNYGGQRITFGGFPGPATVSTNHNVATFGIGPQIQIDSGPVQPYINGFVGMGYFYTATSFADPWAWGSVLNFDDVAFSYGVGGGLGLGLGPRSPVRLTLDVQYRRHDDVQYLREGGIADDGFGAPIVTPIISDANFFTFQLGAAVGL